MALPGVRAVSVTAQALLSAATLSLRLHRSGLRAVLDPHRVGLRPRWALRMLFLRHRPYPERGAGWAPPPEEKEWTVARCWPITWSLRHPRWVADQTKREPAPRIAALALA